MLSSCCCQAHPGQGCATLQQLAPEAAPGVCLKVPSTEQDKAGDQAAKSLWLCDLSRAAATPQTLQRVGDHSDQVTTVTR